MAGRWLTFLAVAIMALIFAACGANTNDTSTGGGNETNNDTDNDGTNDVAVEQSDYPNAELLVETEWLAEHLGNDDLRLVDMRNDGFEGGHIPGAVPLSSRELNDPDAEIDGMLIEEDAFAELMEAHGISNSDTVVLYDDRGSLSAARLFYALEFYGHTDVRILNGGFNAWLVEGRDLATEAEEVEPGQFVVTRNDDLVADKQYVQDAIEREDAVILDARSEGEYTGDDVRAERGGCILGAAHLEWTEAVEDDDVQYFKSFDELEAQFAAIGIERDQEIIPYCQTNVRGAHTYFALRLLGFDKIRPYEGSWAEWGNDPDTPIEQPTEG